MSHAELDLIGHRTEALPASGAVARLRTAVSGYQVSRALVSANERQQSYEEVIRALLAAVVALHEDLLDLTRRVTALESGDGGAGPAAA